MSLIKSIVQQVKTLSQSAISIQDVAVLSHKQDEILFNVFIGKKNVDENVEHQYSNICKIDSNGLSIVKYGVDTIKNSFTSYSSLMNSLYFAKLQSLDDPDNKAKQKTILEIYKNGDNPYLIHSVNLSKYHGEVLNNDISGRPLRWNLNQDKLIYVANQKKKDNKNYFQQEEDEDNKNTGKDYQAYEQDWGEQLQGVINTSLYIFDLNLVELYEAKVSTKNLFYAYPQFDHEGQLIFCGYEAKEFKYGIAHCYNRDAKIYRSASPSLIKLHPKPKKEDKDQKEEQIEAEIISEDDCSFGPILNKNRKKLFYSGSKAKHQHCFNLAGKIIDLQTNEIKLVVPIIHENLMAKIQQDFNERNTAFNGKCGFYAILNSANWLKDDKHFIFESISLGQQSIFVVNTETNELIKISDTKNKQCQNASIIQYNVESDTLFCMYESIGKRQQLGVLPNLTQLLNQPGLLKEKQMNWQFLNLNSPPQVIEEQFIYSSNNSEGFLWSKQADSIPHNQRPLILFVHGGPHSATLSQYTIARDMFLSSGLSLSSIIGYSILAPNYTGSLGYGQKYIEGLSGNIGRLDVEEILDMMRQVRGRGLCHPTKAVVVGGSYGGYLAGIFGSRHGELFQGAVLMNPVLNLPFSINITDIPDWNLSVALNQEKNWNLSAEDYSKQYDCSPMQSSMKVPSILFLGAKDRRVPYQSGLAFQAQQLFNGQQIQTYVYPEADHSLSDSIHTSLDVIIKTIMFIQERFKEQ